jgi:hypothetical protein
MPDKDTGIGLEFEFAPLKDISSIPLPTLEPTIDIGS